MQDCAEEIRKSPRERFCDLTSFFFVQIFHFLENRNIQRPVKKIKYGPEKKILLRGRPYMTSDARGGGGVHENLMISDEGGRGGQAKSDVRLTLAKNPLRTQFFSQAGNTQKVLRIFFWKKMLNLGFLYGDTLLGVIFISKRLLLSKKVIILW